MDWFNTCLDALVTREDAIRLALDGEEVYMVDIVSREVYSVAGLTIEQLKPNSSKIFYIKVLQEEKDGECD